MEEKIRAAITVSVEASIRVSNGVEVAIDSRTVKLHRMGARGGAGPCVEIPLSDWEAVNQGVIEVRAAISRANAFVKEVGAK